MRERAGERGWGSTLPVWPSRAPFPGDEVLFIDKLLLRRVVGMPAHRQQPPKGPSPLAGSPAPASWFLKQRDWRRGTFRRWQYQLGQESPPRGFPPGMVAPRFVELSLVSLMGPASTIATP